MKTFKDIIDRVEFLRGNIIEDPMGFHIESLRHIYSFMKRNENAFQMEAVLQFLIARWILLEAIEKIISYKHNPPYIFSRNIVYLREIVWILDDYAAIKRLNNKMKYAPFGWPMIRYLMNRYGVPGEEKKRKVEEVLKSLN